MLNVRYHSLFMNDYGMLRSNYYFWILVTHNSFESFPKNVKNVLWFSKNIAWQSQLPIPRHSFFLAQRPVKNLRMVKCAHTSMWSYKNTNVVTSLVGFRKGIAHIIVSLLLTKVGIKLNKGGRPVVHYWIFF